MKFQRTKVAAALSYALGIGGVLLVTGAPVQAADIKVEVTGSNIKRVEGEGALPLQVITREELDRTGAVNAQELLQILSSNQSAGALVTSNVTGATTFSQQAASLRGLGPQRTLVLINGQRQVGFAGTIQGTGGVDLNAIPYSAIERVEVLKDGSSAVYGSDAIAGVINFILRQDYQGAEVTAQYGVPTRSGDGTETQVKASVGWGDLTKDRYNVFLTGSYLKQDALLLRDRDFAKTSYIPNIGLFSISGNTFPAYISTGGIGSPGYPNCNSTYASINDPENLGNRCWFDPSLVAQAIPELTQGALYGAATFQINPNWQAYVNGTYTKAETKFTIQPTPISNQFPTDEGSPAQLAGYDGSITIKPANPNYPTAAAIAAGVNGQPLNVRYRCVECGDRSTTDTSEQWGFAGGFKGNAYNWDMAFSANYSESQNKEVVNDGFVFLSKILPVLNSNQFNPFGPNTAAVSKQIQDAKYVGDTWNATSKLYGADAKASREVYQLPAGPMALALGASVWKEEFDQKSNPVLGLSDLTGYGGSILGVNKSRDVWAMYGELVVPIVKTLEMNLAVRYDDYSDFGGTTNPKVSLRWQPTSTVLLRGSYGTGFLAPSLYQLYVPNTSGVTQPGISDPVRCPVTKDSNDCNTQFGVTFGGNPNLQPEESWQVNAGVVFEPVRGLSLALDWYKIRISQAITNGPAPLTVLGDLAQYGNLVTRGPRDPAFPNLPGPITDIDQRYQNLGGIHIEGIDVDFRYTFPKQDWGQLNFSTNGSYLIRYDNQQTDGTWLGGIGTMYGQATSGVVPRFKNYATLGWTLGPWQASLANTYQTGYVDNQTDINGDLRRVSSMSLWDIQGTYTGFKHFKLTLGAKNMFDTNPPLTNQATTFQNGYDPSYYDARARFVYANVTYSYK
jgi:iron complex outermembrane receptor protein